MYVYIFTQIYRFGFILPIVTQETPIFIFIKLVPMNPDVSLAEKDVLKRPLFRDDDKLLIKVTNFGQDLL